MSFYVYMILSINNKKNLSYVGYSDNISRRLSLHNKSKGAKFTRGKKWILIYSKKYSSKSVAMKEEYRLKKNYQKRKKIKSEYLKLNNMF